MNKLTPFLISSTLLLGLVGCNPGADTATNNSTTTPNSPAVNTNAPDQGAKKDATSDVRKEQLKSDIRSREQRNNAGGDPLKRADGDLESEVRSKLEANLPSSKLKVQAKDGAVTVLGTVASKDQLAKIQKLAKEIKGVKTVAVQAQVAATKTP